MKKRFARMWPKAGLEFLYLYALGYSIREAADLIRELPSISGVAMPWACTPGLQSKTQWGLGDLRRASIRNIQATGRGHRKGLGLLLKTIPRTNLRFFAAFKLRMQMVW